ncbi:hypothetical protein B9T29_05775 [Acinetobacter sp. ANC 3903]|uniref:hypothetical protein n=1 Tax=Acinetobacter sp. ANC 3903 TaxID=1977883 RepID=UPI000A336E25|nr:hypothetical protein [Acinetobacter sp. ANC 3903]OTG62726.1 hypothetical protein B9T29_05775 [Acinetobacter sp. ANC 3903]
MLVKIEDGFYLNTQHIIAIRVSKNATDGNFVVAIEYTPNNIQSMGSYEKAFNSKLEAEIFLQTLHQHISKV